MATQARTGEKSPPKQAATPPKQSQKLPLKVRVNWLNPDEESAIRATASLTLGGTFAVHGIKVIDGSKGQFVSMPGYKSGENYKDIFHAITADARQQMNDAVMAAYEQKLTEEQTQEQDEYGEEMDEESPGDEPAEAEEGQAMHSMRIGRR
jgi:stage V sporulation protein G